MSDENELTAAQGASAIPRALAAAGLSPGDRVTVHDSISGTWIGTVTAGDFVNDLIGINPDNGDPCRYRFASEITRNDGETVRHRGIAAWEQVMRARSGDQAHAVVDRLDGPALRVVIERMGLPAAESEMGMREQVAAAVEQRAEDLQLYEQQPFDDLTGVPDDAGQRPCPRDGCAGTLKPVAGTQHFGADGGALVGTECDQGCGISSGDSWVWSTHEAPAEDPTYYPEDEDTGEPGDPSPAEADHPVTADDDADGDG